MSNLLLVTRTGDEITQGSTLHATTGAVAGQAWKFEHIAEKPDGLHHVHVTRTGGGRVGRIHREFHPGVFGLEIKVDITWTRHARNVAHHVRTKLDDYLMAGAVALAPLALYEHFDVGARITSFLGK